MKKVFFLILFIGCTAKADVDPAWSSLCASMTKMQAIAASYTIFPATMPLPPYVGITLGMVQQNNVILEICDLVEALEKADTMSAIDISKNTLNKMTDSKWMEKAGFDNDQFEWVRDNLVSPDADTNRGKWMEARAHSEADAYGQKMQKYYNENFNKNTESVSEKEREDERRRKMAESAKNVAVLRETIKCPNAEDKPNYTKIYKNDIQPNELLKENAQLDIDYFYDKLKELGSKLAASEKDMDKYMRQIAEIKSSGAYTTRAVGKYDDSKQSVSTSKGKPVMKTVAVSKKYFTYTAKEIDELYTHFKEDYDQAFKKLVRYMYLTNTTQFGLFDGADKRVEQSFRELSFECSERRLMKDYDKKKDDYPAVYEQRKEDCNKGFKTTQSDSESLFSKYLTELRNALYTNRKATSSIWSTESRYLGIHRVPRSDDSQNVVAQDETSCESNFSQKEIDALKLKIKNEENNLKAQSADAISKKTSLKAAKQAEKKADFDEYQKQKAFESSNNQFQQDAANEPMTLTPIRSKVEIKK